MRIGLIDFGGKQVNLALMKLSTWHKQRGDTVILNHFQPEDVDKVYISVLFNELRDKAAEEALKYENVEVGGTGWDLTTELPADVESCQPDYDLYTVDEIYPRIGGFRGTKGKQDSNRQKKLEKATEIVNSGIGFLSRGCVRRCSFCVVPKKEGYLHKVNDLSSLINPRSNIVTIMDANLTANPDVLDILDEVIERKLVINLTQGLDIRTMTPELAEKLSHVRFYGSGKGKIHYAWDEMPAEKMVMRGIRTLLKFVAKSRHMCYILVGFNTTFEEDMYRVRKLEEMNVDPYVMRFHTDDPRTNHFARWVNRYFYRKGRGIPFAEYQPWVNAQKKLGLVY